MTPDQVAIIARELELQPAAVQATADLLKQEASVPFIARYRKEVTGSLDEVVITAIRNRLNQLEELDARRIAVLKSLEIHGHLTDEIKQNVVDISQHGGVGRYLPALPPQAQNKGNVSP